MSTTFRDPLQPAPVVVPVAETLEEGSSLWLDAWRRLRKNRMALFGLITFALMTLTCVFLPFALPYDYQQQELSLGPSKPAVRIYEYAIADRPDQVQYATADRLRSLMRSTMAASEVDQVLARLDHEPEITLGDKILRRSSRIHLFGTDTLGRDQLARVFYGGRISLGVGFLATAVSLVIGVLYGAISGYIGGKLDAVMMRLVDILYALPFTIFVILLMVFFNRSLTMMFIAIGAVEWLTMARIVRSQVQGLKRQEFVEAAVSLGFGTPRIILRHLVPNVLGPIIVFATLTVPKVMLLESFLSFLGLGVQPPLASWGVLIKDGADSMTVHPFMLVVPAFFFSLTLFSLNFLGDGLRDALDPKSSKD